MYLDNLITGHTFGSMLNKLNELKLQKELEIIIMCFGHTTRQKQTTNANLIILARAGN